jgi:hypothetical protein
MANIKDYLNARIEEYYPDSPLVPGRVAGIRYTCHSDPVKGVEMVRDAVTGRAFSLTSEQARSMFASKDEFRRFAIRQLSEPVSREAHEQVLRDLEMLKRRFESLFKIPADKVSPPKIENSPEHPEQWRIRIKVEAFEVETTIGELAAAKANPSAAFTWVDRIRAVPGGTATSAQKMQEGLERAQHEIMRTILTKGVVESAQDSAALDESHVLKEPRHD